MSPTEHPGSNRGKPTKRKAPSIRDAAASAAGSAPAPPPPEPAGRARPRRRVPPTPASKRPPGRSPEPAVNEPIAESEPAFPDFDSPPARWDPWDENIGTEADGGGPDFDPQRTLGDWLEAVIPPEAQVHFIRAGQEFAAGVQTTVDHHLGRGAGADGVRPGPSRIEIE